LIFEGDLIWIRKDGNIEKAGEKQSGFYGMVNGLGLKVDTVIQAWNINSKNYKTIIPFSEIESSVNFR
jgi:hypothetical protein